MYHTIYLDERVALTPGELNGVRTTDAIRDLLITKLRDKHEGKCNANGYIRPGSLQVLARSMGAAQNGKFTGDFVYDCKTKCDVLYPTADSILEVTVIKTNKMGAYAVFEEAIRVLLPRDLHIGNTSFDEIQDNDTVRIRIKRTRFDTNSPFIMAVGVLENQPDSVQESGEEAAFEVPVSEEATTGTTTGMTTGATTGATTGTVAAPLTVLETMAAAVPVAE